MAVFPLAVLAVISAVAAVASYGRLTGAALFLLAAEYALVELDSRVGPASIVLYAAGLVVLCELLLWSGQLPRRAVADRAVVVQRVVTLGLIALGAVLVALSVLAAAGTSVGGSYQGPLVGVAAAVVVLLVPWVLLRRKRSDV
ncbi:MAG: hypothetical protein JXA87_15045 [Thermoleophilia bacterium]|nr:hypothetical protein [Thermoleophilia bacterium]